MDKRIKDLDDVDKLLQESSAEEIIARNRNRRRRREIERNRKRNRRRDMGIVAIPGIIVVLMLLIVILDHTGISATDDAGNAVGAEVATETVEMTGETETAAAEESEEDNTVRQYNDDVLESFFQRYFEAKLNADVDTIYQMSGVTNQTEEQAAQLRNQLKTQSGYIEKYQDISLYAVKGLGANDKLVFVTYNVKFRRADTLAPAIMYCYMRVNEQNEFELVENMSPEQVKLVNEYTQNHDEVKELINAQDSKLLAAISSDARLAVIYDAFQTGRIYTEDQSAIDSEVSLISVETEPETTAAAATSSSDSESSKSKKSEEKETEEETKSSRKKETEAETTKAAGTKSSSAETTAEEKGSVLEAGGDPGQGDAGGPAAAGASAETAGAGAPAQGGDVIEGQDLQ